MQCTDVVFVSSQDVVIGFERTMYNVRENDGQVDINVVVVEGRVTGDVLVRFRTRDGSALCKSLKRHVCMYM